MPNNRKESHLANIITLTDKGAGGPIRGALTIHESGAQFLVPALTGGTQTIDLPPATAANIGFTCTFTANPTTTVGQTFNVKGNGTDTIAIISAIPDGDGTYHVQTTTVFGFTGDAAIGCSFTITLISLNTFHISTIVSGATTGTGEHFPPAPAPAP